MASATPAQRVRQRGSPSIPPAAERSVRVPFDSHVPLIALGAEGRVCHGWRPFTGSRRRDTSPSGITTATQGAPCANNRARHSTTAVPPASLVIVRDGRSTTRFSARNATVRTPGARPVRRIVTYPFAADVADTVKPGSAVVEDGPSKSSMSHNHRLAECTHTSTASREHP
jgi:hypothetical protein